MDATDAVTGLYPGLVDTGYDCVDRVVLRAYYRFVQDPGGFRLWWRRWQGSEEGLDNTHLMRIAGRFSRRVKAWAGKAGVPVIYTQAGERKDDIAARYLPTDPEFCGVFLILVGRAPGSVWDVDHTSDGRIRDIHRKDPKPWVNHYAFHIMDREWGHVIVRFCPHPPFNALVLLNGHEWVAKEAERRGVPFVKEDNCFTEVSDAAGLGLVAETLSSESSIGRLVQVCDRWIYSAVLCFALDIADQERTGFHYDYSVFQAEYSRNLLFQDGRQMDQLFHGLIDRIRGPLDIRTVKTLFGRRQRPRKQKGQPRVPVEEVALERPAYDLTILRLHFGRVTLKIYTKGGRVLRIEAMAHNVRDLRCRRGVSYFPETVVALRGMVDRFVELLDCMNTAFIDPGLLDDLSQSGSLGAVRVGGIDVNKARIRAVMEAVLALSPDPRGFTASEVAAQVRQKLGDDGYSTSRAAYDLRKLRSKELVTKIPRSRRYSADARGLRAMAALLILRDKVIRPLLAAASRTEPAPEPSVNSVLDLNYRRVQEEMDNVFTTLGIAA